MPERSWQSRRLGLPITTWLALVCAGYVVGQVTEVEVELSAPRWVARGGSATLRCLHQVPAQLLYKVEFLRTGAKLMQYVRERNPPYTNYTVPGGRLNMSLSSESSITIQNLDFSASAIYWCEVSLETPIYTAASPARHITVVHPQKHPPIITFGDPDVVVGGMLRANCTSAPAAPAPHLTWFIDGNKVQDESLRFYSYRVSSSYRSAGKWRKHRHRNLAPSETNHVLRREPLTHLESSTSVPLANATKNHVKCRLKDGPNEELRNKPVRPPSPPAPAPLTVTVSELRVPAHGKLQLTCMATIPALIGPGEQYADMKKQTVTVAVNELQSKKPAPDASTNQSSGARQQPFSFCVVLYCTILFLNYLVSTP